jgi:hypothetical protein
MKLPMRMIAFVPLRAFWNALHPGLDFARRLLRPKAGASDGCLSLGPGVCAFRQLRIKRRILVCNVAVLRRRAVDDPWHVLFPG